MLVKDAETARRIALVKALAVVVHKITHKVGITGDLSNINTIFPANVCNKQNYRT